MLNLADIIKKVRQLEIRTNREIDELTSGAYKSVFQGRGIEFDEVREYTESDDARDIDWNVTARMNQPFIKKYIEERELTIMLLADISKSEDFSSNNSNSKRNVIAELSAILSLSAIRNQDKAGLMLFTDKRELYMSPKNSMKHVLQLIRQVMFFEPENHLTDIGKAIKELNNLLNKRSIIFILSDMIDDKDYLTSLKILSKRHDVIILRIIDPIEQSLSINNSFEMIDAETNELVYFAGGNAQKNYNELAKVNLDKNREIIEKIGVEIIDIFTNSDTLRPLLEFFRKRKKHFKRRIKKS